MAGQDNKKKDSIEQKCNLLRSQRTEADLIAYKSCQRRRFLGGSTQYFSAMPLQKAFLHLPSQVSQQMRLVTCLISNRPWEEQICVLICN